MNARCMRIVGTRKNKETQIRIVFKFVMGWYIPIFSANYKDVPLSKIIPPAIVPVVWQAA